MKKVLFIVPSLSKGGAERVVSNLSKGLSDEWEKYIAVFDGSRIDYDYEGELIEMDVSSETNRILRDCRGLKELKKIKEEIDPAVSVSFLPEPNLINILSRRKDEKTVISVRNMLSRTVEQPGLPYSFLSKIMIKSLYNRADKIVPVSKGVEKDLIDNFNVDEERTNVIYNPCDVESIRKLAEEEIPEDERPLFQGPSIINVSSLTKQKGHWHLIRAFWKVNEEMPDSNLILIGSGDLEEKLKELTEKLKLEDSVHFLGFKDNPFKYVSRSDLFVLSSLYEGLPNVIIESLACGTPVISTDCKSGPREILAPNTNITKDIKDIEKSEYGILTPTPDGKKRKAKEPLTKEEKTLSKAITQIINNKKMKKKCSEKSKERAKNFKQEKTVNKWKELIGEHYGG